MRFLYWVTVALTVFVAPGAALAHTSERGFILLLPTEYYLIGGSLSVAFSLVVMALVSPTRIQTLFDRVATLPWLDFSRLAPIVSALSFLGFGFILYTGVAGARDPLTNPLPLTVWVIGWIGVTVLHALVGNLWAVLNPWRFPVRMVRRAAGLPAEGEGFWTLPSWLKIWPAILLFAGIAWYELVDLAPDDPDRLAVAVAAYWLIAFLGCLSFGERAWLSQCEPLSLLFRYLALLSPFAVTRGAGGTRLAIGWPGRHVLGAAAPSVPIALFLLLTLATVSFDGLNMTFWWLGLHGINPLEFPGRSAVQGINSAGLLGAWAVLSLVYVLAIWGGQLLSGRRGGAADAIGLFVLSILPISLAYHFSHYLTVFMINGQWAIVAANDPLATGADWFGLADFRVTASFLNVAEDVERIWQVQVFAIVMGHVLAVVLAHGLTARMVWKSKFSAVLSQVPLGILMVLYTLFGLWLLSSPTGG